MTAMLHFWKMTGAGNDFVVVDNRRGNLQLDARTIARICDRHRGVGADGLLLLEPAQNGGDFRMRYYNADGGEAEMCGNGARCFARFAQRVAGPRERVSFETPAGMISAALSGELVTLRMSEPRGLRLNEQITAHGQTVTVHSVDTGVPHAIVVVDDLEHAPVHQLGAAIRHHEHFAPKGTNVNFVRKGDDDCIDIRTYERGVEGETLACGTGVVATALVVSALQGAASPVSVRVRGGDTLRVAFRKEGDTYNDVTLTGPADFVFEGEIAL